MRNSEEGSVMNVYCCGGTGVNIGAELEAYQGQHERGFSEINIYYIDTSHANLRGRNIDASRVYLIDGRSEGRDGSGGIRAENNARISERMADIMLKMPAAKYNVVLFSASGGSGSAAGPHLIRHLMEEDCIVVAMVVSDTNTIQYAHNSVNTYKSLSGVVGKMEGRSLPIFSHINRPGQTERSVNSKIISDIGLLSILFSEQLRRLDYADIYNWANQERITKIHAPLTFVGQAIFDKAGKLLEEETRMGVMEHLVTGVAIQMGEDHVPPVLQIPYAKTGIALESYEEFFGNDHSFMLVTSTDIEAVYKELAATRQANEKTMKARSKSSAIAVDNADDDGMVL